MKKSVVLLSVLLLTGWTIAFAGKDPGVSPRVEAAFKKEFPAAQSVKWIQSQEYHKAVFVLLDYRVEAVFSDEGKLLETKRDLLYHQLPLAVIKELEYRFPGAEITEIKEVNTNGNTTYRLLAETKKRGYRVVATPDGNISITERLKK